MGALQKVVTRQVSYLSVDFYFVQFVYINILHLANNLIMRIFVHALNYLEKTL